MVGDDCSDGGELVVAQAKPICSGTHSPEDVLGEEDGGASRLRSNTGTLIPVHLDHIYSCSLNVQHVS